MANTGLCIGKYAPFHKGHKYVIDTALSEMDEVLVMVCEDAATDIPLQVRSNWIRNSYCDDRLEVIDCYNCPQEVGYTPEIMAAHETYYARVLDSRKITHFYSSERYGEHMSKSLGAVDRRVDMDRTTFPVCATDIRENAYKYREFVPDVVYPDLITRVVFLGSESTGKSTISKVLAERFDTQFVAEFGAQYWFENQKDGILTPEQLLEIAYGHQEKEDKAILKSNKYCFIDTNAITTYMFSTDYHGYAIDELEWMAYCCRDRYDLTFLCETDIPYADTWDRRGAENRKVFQKKIVNDLVARKIPFIRLCGTVDERVKKVTQVLHRFSKWDYRID